MRELNFEELGFVSGGDVAPACATTSSGTTVCSCPSGTTPKTVTIGGMLAITCAPVAVKK